MAKERNDSTAIVPSPSLPGPMLAAIREQTRRIARGLGVVGLLNVQFAVAAREAGAPDELYVLEANPRASRTVPFLAKATGVPLANIATKLVLGRTLAELGLEGDLEARPYFVKAPVFPFNKFGGADPRLSPEMKSTGEVMGFSPELGKAYFKAQLAAGMRLPARGAVFVTVNDRDKEACVPIAREYRRLGFSLVATRGTAAALRAAGVEVRELLKRSEGRPDCVDAIRSGTIALVINTPLGAESYRDGWAIRTAAVEHGVPFITTLAGARAAAEAIAAVRNGVLEVTSLQELHGAPRPAATLP